MRYNSRMKEKIARAADKTGKILILTALAAAFVFTGWRIATRKAYIAHEKAQCCAMAASAALCAADAVAHDAAVASLVKESNSVEYISEHRKMPESINVKVIINSEGNSFLIKSIVSSGWNSRSPQSSSFSLKLDETENIIFESGADAEAAALVAAARSDISPGKKQMEHIFTFPNERPCPAPFAAKSASVSCFGEKDIWIVFFDRQNS